MIFFSVCVAKNRYTGAQSWPADNWFAGYLQVPPSQIRFFAWDGEFTLDGERQGFGNAVSERAETKERIRERKGDEERIRERKGDEGERIRERKGDEERRKGEKGRVKRMIIG